METHVGHLRRDTAQKRIKLKIKVLERYVKDGVPEGASSPKNMAEFRRWEDAKLGLEKIGSPNTLDRPHNLRLKKRAQELIERITQDQRRKSRGVRATDTHKRQARDLTKLVSELTSQLHSTRHELTETQQRERRWKKRADDLTVENGELLRQLATVTSMRALEGKAG